MRAIPPARSAHLPTRPTDDQRLRPVAVRRRSGRSAGCEPSAISRNSRAAR